MGTMPPSRPLLLAYLHLRPGTPAATCALLQDYLANFAESTGYILSEVVVGMDHHSERSTVRNLVERIQSQNVDRVVVSRATPAALAAIQQLSGVQVLTLADVSAARQAKH